MKSLIGDKMFFDSDVPLIGFHAFSVSRIPADTRVGISRKKEIKERQRRIKVNESGMNDCGLFREKQYNTQRQQRADA